MRRPSNVPSNDTISMKRFFKIYLEKPELAGLVFLVILTIVFQARSGGVFLNAINLQGILGLLPEVALVAMGVTLLMICGEFDLSVGSVFALTPMSMAVLLEAGWPFFPAISVGLFVAMAVGFVNGVLTVKFAIPSFITTLGMLLSRTNFGNWVRATGGFLPAAKSMGIPTKRVKIACFMICSLLAGFAGTLQVMRLGAPLPSIGEGLELQAVAAAVIGGTALTGGIGTILGGIIGATLIRVIDNGLVLSQVDANWFKMALGALTVFAVILNAWLRKKAKSIKVETGK